MTALMITADDFGLCPEIDEAICLLHDRGIVGRTSLLVNTPSFASSVDALGDRPALEVAIHLNLTDGQPVLSAKDVPTLVTSRGCFHGGRHYGIIAAIASGRMSRREIHAEWRAQIAKARGAGIAIQELNSHGHLHLLPRLHDVVLELLREFEIPRVRLVRSSELPRGILLDVCSRGLRRKLGQRGIAEASPSRTLGLRHPGAVDRRILLRDLALGGDTTTELIVHPSRGANYYHTRWGYAGDEVLNWLLSDTASSAAKVADADPAAANAPTTSVSVIVPTYREAANVATLVRRVKTVAEANLLQIEMLIVDDRSDDGIVEAVRALGEDSWLLLVTRAGPRSLSGAVLEGFRRARCERCVVMDGDLSHPPEAIPQMLAALDDPGVDFVFGSRYIAGGTTDAAWPLTRRVNSFLGRVMARPLGIDARDPTSGFFAVRRSRVLAAADLNPIGYKVALEILVKCHCRNIREVPIHFRNRLYGKTKLGLRQQLEYLEHLRRLWQYQRRTRAASPPAGRAADDLR